MVPKINIPENKYIAICKGKIIMVGDSPSELAQRVVKAHIHDSVHIKFTGTHEEDKSIEIVSAYEKYL